jgi:adenylylsulfate kinase
MDCQQEHAIGLFFLLLNGARGMYDRSKMARKPRLMSETPKADNLVRHAGTIGPEDRARLLRQRGCVVWLTGLSGSGKSTIAHALEARLHASGHASYVLDGDNVRHGLNRDLTFSPEDRTENIRRIGEVAALFADAGLITLVAFISPYRAGRDAARTAAGEGRFIETFIDVPIETCAQRDPKGLYEKAQNGEIPDFTGISAPYEAPERPEIVIPSGELTLEDSVVMLETFLKDNGFIWE